MLAHRISTAILSLTAPGSGVLEGDLEVASAFCRSVNEYAAALCKEHPKTFGFFAVLPPLAGNLEAVLWEAAYCLDILKADGVTLYTR